MKHLSYLFLIIWVVLGTACEDDKDSYTTIGFEDLALESSGYWNGSDLSGGFATGGISFKNSYNDQYASWSGFAYSNLNDKTSAEYSNQYSVFATATGTFVLTYVSGETALVFDTPTEPESIQITNSTLAALVMANGNTYSKKFGGADGTDPDYFKLTIIGLDAADNLVGNVEVYLADFRSDVSSEDYILDTWKKVSLDAFGTVKSLRFTLKSSDVGQWGMNTPAYFCLDNLEIED